ncbi:PaaI family thioesterase [Pseudooceanicola sp. LIPI14-2-Ac024]|uniref:PaaI family thioesterase n=1 Tax=Pseudooceanicola sp. LIPI14-2-Ac024 TaxID=3344875 RepID=UPI0035CF3ADF
MTIEGAKDLQDAGWEQIEDIGFLDLVGPILRRPDASGVYHYGFHAEERHSNLNGVVQGGMLMTLADRGMGRTVRIAHDDRPVATVHFSYDFIAPGLIGSFIELHPRITRQTGSLVFMESLVFSGDTLIGRSNGVWKKLKAKPV